MDGSSSTYKVLVSELPSAVASVTLCASPPESVRDWRESVRYPSPTSQRKRRRPRISRKSRSDAVSFAFGLKAAKNRSASAMDIDSASGSVLLSMRNSSAAGLSRAPRQSGQGE